MTLSAAFVTAIGKSDQMSDRMRHYQGTVLFTGIATVVVQSMSATGLVLKFICCNAVVLEGASVWARRPEPLPELRKESCDGFEMIPKGQHVRRRK